MFFILLLMLGVGKLFDIVEVDDIELTETWSLYKGLWSSATGDGRIGLYSLFFFDKLVKWISLNWSFDWVEIDLLKSGKIIWEDEKIWEEPNFKNIKLLIIIIIIIVPKEIKIDKIKCLKLKDVHCKK